MLKMFKLLIFWLFLTLVATLINPVSSERTPTDMDDNGYVVYCPCMGRFGNQVDHFLGALAFSKGLNRTLVLPPWVEYRYGEPKSIQVPFDTYFKVDALKKFHRVITMEQFMKNFANTVWPPGERTSFCYTERHGVQAASCNAKEGNPFGPFWDTFSINFDKSEFYGPLNYDLHRDEMTNKWMEKYPPASWPVLAFTGAPASFPVQKENVHLHKYLQWNDAMVDKAKQFIRENMSGGAFIGLHLRNGADWVRACHHISESPALFSAAQCVGYQNQRGPLTQSMCLPTKLDIIKQLKRTLKQVKDVKYVFVASDANHMVEELSEALRRVNVTVRRLRPSDPHLDLAVLAQSNFFIGNCVSSYSAFVKRERDARGLPSGFWAYPPKKFRHEEL